MKRRLAVNIFALVGASWHDVRVTDLLLTRYALELKLHTWMDPALFTQFLTYPALGLCAVDDVHGNMVGVSLSPPHLRVYKLWLAVRWEVCGLSERWTPDKRSSSSRNGANDALLDHNNYALSVLSDSIRRLIPHHFSAIVQSYAGRGDIRPSQTRGMALCRKSG